MNDLPGRLVAQQEHAGLRADVYLALCLPWLARTRIRQKIQMGESLLNGRRYATSARVRPGDLITIDWRGPVERAPAQALDILFEDQWILALDKPAGIASHPMGRIQWGTAIQFAREKDAGQIAAHLARGDADYYPRLVHRLDVFTSGVLLVARTHEAFRAMQRIVEARRLEKTYLAVVEGLLSSDEGRIEHPIARDTSSAVGVKMAVRPDGLPAVTRYEVVQRLQRHTLVRAFPLTGRQHQVRLHFAAIGHPVWGDLLYRDERLFLRYQECLAVGGAPDRSLPPRHLLHARSVAFTHPFTGRSVAIGSPVPPDFARILEGLE
jgi:23S rRNA pseudouridine1911/1915/1917 synthase